MRWSSGTGIGWTLAAALLVLPGSAGAQQLAPEVDSEPVALAMQVSQEEADRETLRRFVAREEVRAVARAADLDLDEASAGILALDSVRLSRAANQARAIESRLGTQDTITISATTLIIILLLVLLIVVVAS